jgi:hypothetical protein
MSPEEKQGPNEKQEGTDKSSYSQQTEAQPTTGAQNETGANPNENQSYEPLRYAKIFANWILSPVRWFRNLSPTDKFTFWVAAFTGVLAIATSFQVWAFIQSERAVLTVDYALEGQRLTADRPIGLFFSIQNSGKSLATITNFNVTLRIIDKLPEAPKYITLLGFALGPIPPAGIGKATYRIPTTTYNLTAESMKEIDSGKWRFYIYGFVEYEDEFSWLFGKKIIGYCSFYTPEDTAGGPFNTCLERKYTYAH